MDANSSSTAELEAVMLGGIPLARAMQISVARYDGNEIVMTAPLAPNVNDKGCAFGGSITSLLTLAGWGLVLLNLRARSLDCDIYVGSSIVRYCEPVWGELRGAARFTRGGAATAMATAVMERGKGHAQVVCEIAGEHRTAVTLTARYFAILRQAHR